MIKSNTIHHLNNPFALITTQLLSLTKLSNVRQLLVLSESASAAAPWSPTRLLL